MDSAAHICWVAKVGKDLVAHSTGLEGSARLHILQLQEDPTSSGPRKACRLNQWCLDPRLFELQLIARENVDVPHFDVLNKWKREKKRFGWSPEESHDLKYRNCSQNSSRLFESRGYTAEGCKFTKIER